MQITRSEIATTKGSADWFTGDVYVDIAIAALPPARSQGGLVHFTPGARTAWHAHPLGQTIFVTEGVGRCQRRGRPVEEIRPGDRVFFEPDEEHWHGAAPDRFMAHMAVTEDPGDRPATDWRDHVSDAEYDPDRH
jgi:quercetin dioxygenase-like cupin family protein